MLHNLISSFSTVFLIHWLYKTLAQNFKVTFDDLSYFFPSQLSKRIPYFQDPLTFNDGNT